MWLDRIMYTKWNMWEVVQFVAIVADEGGKRVNEDEWLDCKKGTREAQRWIGVIYKTREAQEQC